MKYRANSLTDIAEHFLSMAANAEKKIAALPKKTGKEFHALGAEAAVWKAAADTLRNTELGTPEIAPKRS